MKQACLRAGEFICSARETAIRKMIANEIELNQ